MQSFVWEQRPALLRKLFIACYSAATAILLGRLYVMWSLGGNQWQQADWLISFAAGPLRRGLSGTVFLGISDLTGWNIVTVICVTQALIVLVVFWFVCRAFLRTSMSPAILLLALSPAFLLLWASNPYAGFRKEILGVCSFLPLLLCAQGKLGQARCFWLTLLFFSIAVAFHEVNAFFVPFLAMAIFVCNDRQVSRSVALQCLALGGVGLAGLLFATAFAAVSSSQILCDAVIARGAEPQICNGIFRWLEYDLAGHRDTAEFFGQDLKPMTALFAYVVVSIPLIFAIRNAPYKGWLFLAYLISFLWFLPLYLMAVDWGRWIALHLTCLILLGLVVALKEKPEWVDRPLPRIRFWLCLGICLLFGLWHITPLPRQGFALRAAAIAIDPITLFDEFDNTL